MKTTTKHHLAAIGLLGAIVLAAPATAATTTTKKTSTRKSTTTKATLAKKTPVIAAKKTTADTTATRAPSAGATEGDYTMPGGHEGTAFKSLTVEGEDRVHFEFERPKLVPDLDPAKAPGLDPGNPADVLLRSGPDMVTPFAALSARERCAWVARPWLSHFASGPVARFRPDVTDVTRWKLVIANARGEAVATMEDKGRPPQEIVWDGRAKDGSTVIPDLTYSYVFEAHDRAGNKRNFVGEGFTVSAYRLAGGDGPMLVFSGRELAWPEVDARSGGARRSTPPILLEAASWMNQATRPDRGVRVVVTARGYEQAETMAANVVRLLSPQLAGDPARVKSQAVVQPDAPEAGTVAIAYSGK